jgi:hypothetical protein
MQNLSAFLFIISRIGFGIRGYSYLKALFGGSAISAASGVCHTVWDEMGLLRMLH